MTKAVIYVRISDDRVGDALGVGRQEQDGREVCAAKGWEVAEVISDNDISAYSGKRRRGYERLLDGLAAGSWGALVAQHPDRLHRSPKELEAFIDVVEAAGVLIATKQAGDYDLGTAEGRLHARITGAVARHSSEHASERIRRKHRELAETGQPAGGGSRPFGYLPDRVRLDRREAALVRAAARSVLDGATLRSVAVDWQARGVPTVTGTPWTTTVVRRILTSPRAAGLREHGGKFHPGTWTALLDEVTWRRLRAILLDPTRRTNHAPRTYLLTGGMARCALCDHALIARPRSDGARCYVCASGPGFHGCGKIRVLAEPFERDVLGQVAGQIAAGHLPAVPEHVPDLLADIDQAEAALVELADDYYVHHTTTKAQFQSASTSLGAQLDQLRAAAGKAERTRAVGLDEDALDLLAAPYSPRQRVVIEAMASAVKVGSAVRGRNHYDPARVSVAWR